MPFPSKGCKSCRLRRIKCSEERPVCQQCAKSSRECSFSQDTTTIHFRDETAFAKGRARKPRKADRLGSKDGTCHLNFSHSHSASKPNHPSSTMQHAASMPEQLNQRGSTSSDEMHPARLGLVSENQCYIPIEVQAFGFLTRKYFTLNDDLPDNIWGHFTQRQIAFAVSNPDSALGLATSAFALTLFGTVNHDRSVSNAGHRKYFHALKKTRLLLLDENQVLHDDTLITTMVLNQLENSLLEIPDQRDVQDAFKHQEGSAALLNLRRLHGAPLDRDVVLDMQVRRLLIRSCVWRCVPVPECLIDGSKFGEAGYELELDRCMVKAANLRYEASQLSPSATAVSEADPFSFMLRARSIFQNAQALDDEMSLWPNSLPPNAGYRTHLLPELLKHNESITNVPISYDGVTHTYNHLYWAQIWDRYRGARLLTNTILARILQQCSFLHTYPDTILVTQRRIKMLADDICASVAYSLGRIWLKEDGEAKITREDFQEGVGPWSLTGRQAYILVWPLVITSMSREVSQNQRDWAKAHLKLISKVTGNRQVIALTQTKSRTQEGATEERGRTP